MKNINSKEFKEEVIKSQIPVLVKFGAAWCSPCRAMQPTLEALEKEADGKYKIVTVEVDDNHDIMFEYEVSHLPTVMLFKNGKVEKKLVGLQNKKDLQEFLK